MDDNFKEAYFLPWIGKNYAIGYPWGGRTLILGESHYCSHIPSRTFTRDLTEEYLTGEWTHPFWTKLGKVFTGQDSIERSSFWHSVSFYNYIQEPVDDVGIRPTEAMWLNAERPLLEVMNKLLPDYVIVCGKELWDRIPAQFLDLTLEPFDICYYSKPDGKQALSTMIYHPSSFGFSSLKWHQKIKTFFAWGNNYRQHSK